MSEAATVSARPDRLRAFRVTAGEIADALTVRRAAVLRAVREYQLATEPAFRAPADDVADVVAGAVVAVRDLGGFAGAVGDAFASVAGDHVVGTSPGAIDARLAASSARHPASAAVATGFGDDLLEQWDASRDRPWPDRAARSVLDATIEAGFTVGGGLLGGAVAVAACRGAAACEAPGVALGRRAGHWVGERVTELVGLGDDPEPGHHRRGEVRDDVAGLDGDDEEAIGDLVADAARAHDVAAGRAGARTDAVLRGQAPLPRAYAGAPALVTTTAS